MNLRKLRALSHVWRWNFHPRVRQESVAEHSYWTAIYAVRLLDRLNISAAQYVDAIQYALYHDAEEAITGDLPWPVKRGKAWKDVHKEACSEINDPCLGGSLREDVKASIKAADLFSALVFVDEEVYMGNNFFMQIRGELIGAILALKLDAANELLAELGFQRNEARPFHSEMSHL